MIFGSWSRKKKFRLRNTDQYCNIQCCGSASIIMRICIYYYADPHLFLCRSGFGIKKLSIRIRNKNRLTLMLAGAGASQLQSWWCWCSSSHSRRTPWTSGVWPLVVQCCNNWEVHVWILWHNNAPNYGTLVSHGRMCKFADRLFEQRRTRPPSPPIEGHPRRSWHRHWHSHSICAVSSWALEARCPCPVHLAPPTSAILCKASASYAVQQKKLFLATFHILASQAEVITNLVSMKRHTWHHGIVLFKREVTITDETLKNGSCIAGDNLLKQVVKTIKGKVPDTVKGL